MKTRKKILPKWIVKSIKPGEEDESVSSAVAAALAMYLIGIVWIYYIEPFGEGNRLNEVCLDICILTILVVIGFFFITNVALLQKTRIKISNDYKKIKLQVATFQSNEEKILAGEKIIMLEERLEELCVPLDWKPKPKQEKKLKKLHAS